MDSSIAGESKHFLFDNRESWLKAAITELAPTFESIGLPLPENLRCAIGFPSGGRRGRTIGECWVASRSADKHVEIFIRCDLDDPITVVDTLTHELTHAGLPEGAAHGRSFRQAALKLGLVGPMRHASAGPLLRQVLAVIAAKLGPLPHAKLNFEHGRPNRPAQGVEQDGAVDAPDTPKPQPARLLKAECVTCGYTCRVTRKWIAVGAPHCPNHGSMRVEYFERAEGAPQPHDFDDAHAGNENGLISAPMVGAHLTDRS